MSFNATNPVTVGAATKKDHYDRVFDNTVDLRAGAFALASQAVGDLISASSTTQFAPIAAVATGQVLISAGVGVAPTWSATPLITAIVFEAATTAGVRVDLESGALAIREGDDSGYANIKAAAATFTGTVSTTSGQKFQLDGGTGSVYFAYTGGVIRVVESGIARMDLSGTITMYGAIVADGGNIILSPTYSLYLDGGSNTYIRESSADTMALVTGGSTAMSLTSSAVTSTNLTVTTAGNADITIKANSAANYPALLFNHGSSQVWQVYSNIGATPSLIFYSGGTTTAATLSAAGALSLTGAATATAFIPSSSTVPTNGMYLPAANTLGFANNSTLALSFGSGQAATFAGQISVPATSRIYLDGGGDTYLYESAANVMSVRVGGNERITLSTAGAFFTVDISVPATSRVYLDGGADTYIHESSANVIGMVAGTTTIVNVSSSGLNVLSGALYIPTGQNIYLDGGGNTYIYESSADVITLFAGGVSRFRIHGVSGGISMNSAEKFYIDGLGDTYFWESSANTFQCVAGGSGGVNLTSGATAWAAVSDERRKHNLVAIKDAASKLSTVRAVTGEYLTDSRRRSFFIAQDWERILPESVTEGEDGLLMLRYTDTLPLVAAAVNEHTTELDRLKHEAAALNERIAALEAA